MLSIRAIKLILIFNLTAVIANSAHYSSSAALHNNSINTAEIIGNTNVCYNDSEYYRTIAKPNSETCDYFYTWTVSGGEFADGSTVLTGYGEFNVYVTWLTGRDTYSLHVLVNGEGVPPGVQCQPNPMEKEGTLTPVFTGDANVAPPVSTWRFEGEDDEKSLICSADGTITATEEMPNSDYSLETKLFYVDSSGSEIVVKNWNSTTLSTGYTFTPNYVELHDRIKLFKQSRYVNCPSIAATEDFEIDFFQKPEIIMVGDPSPPKCNLASGAVTYKVNSTKINSCTFSFDNEDDGLDRTFTSTIPPDSIINGYSYFNLNSSIELDFNDSGSGANTTVNLNLETANWRMDVEFDMRNAEGDTIAEYPCSVSDSFVIGPVQGIEFINNLSANDTILNCQNFTTTLTVKADADAGDSIEYKLFKDGVVSDSIIGSGEQNFIVSPGEYFVIAKYIDCNYEHGPTVTSDTININYHQISLSSNYPVAADMDGNDSGNGETLKCHDGLGKITINVSDSENGTIDYRLINSNNELLRDTANISSGDDFTFNNLSIGNYIIEAKYSGCTNWDEDNILTTDSISITAPNEISLEENNIINNPPTCENGDGGSFVFSANGGNSESYEIVGAVINGVEADSANFIGLEIVGLTENDNVTSVTIADSTGCSELFDTINEVIPPAEYPFQFTSQTTTQPQCYDSNGIFEFSYTHANVADSLIYKYVVSAGAPCIANENCDSNDDISVSSPEINLDRTNNSLTVSVTEIANNTSGYQVYLYDDQCAIVSDIISFTEKSQPSFSSNSPFQIPCKGDFRDINLSINDDQGSFNDFNLQLERKASSESEFTPSNMDTVSISENQSGTLTIENLYEGNYKISGTDGLGCTFAEYEFELVEPAIALTINASPEILFPDTAGEEYHISEYGASDGEISFNASGGQGDYTFTLFADGTEEATATNETSGFFLNLEAKDEEGNPIEYFTSVEDELNCIEYSDTFTLTEPDSLIFTSELNNYISSGNDTFNIKCYGGTDTIRVETEGGVYPHLVRLINSNSQEQNRTLFSEIETAVFQDLPRETYRIEVIDKYFDGIDIGLRTNIFSDSIDFVQPDSLSVITNMTQPICYGDSTGSITITPSGGVPFANGEYDIHIFDQDGSSIINETTDELSILADEGNYYYTVFDAFECEYNTGDEYHTGLGNLITVTELSPRLSVAKDTITYPPCAGDETATLSVSATGGRSEDATYILELYDNNDPPLYGPNPLIDSVSTVDSGYYTFQNLFTGDYTVIVYDDSLCSDFVEITIEERDDPLEFISIESILSKCANSSDAKLKITSAGGDSPHLFSLDNINFYPIDSTTTSNDGTETYHHKTFTGLVGDNTYTIYLKDDNYYDSSYNNVCLIETTQIIPKTPSLALSFEKTDILCFGDESGEFTLSPSYGNNDNINDFNINIDGPNGVISHDQGYVDSLSAGSYEVEITLKDTTACQTPLFARIDIDQPEPLTVEISSATDYNCSTIEDIILSGAIGGGLSTDKYLYAINSDNSADFDSLEISKGEFRIKRMLEPGWNTFYLKSSYNCLASDSFFIESVVPIIQVLSNHSASCNDRSDGEIGVISSFEKLDFKLMNLKDTFSIADKDTAIFEGLEAGIYQLTGSSSSCLADTLEIIINQPDSIVIQPGIIELPSCNQANGLGSVIITGGTSPYQVFWQLENGNILDSTSLKSGYYDILIEDANNCSAIFPSFFVGETNDFNVSIQNSSNPTCGENNGSILIQTHEGVPPYDINWFKDGSLLLNDTDSLTELSEGSYIFSVTDAMGCFFEDSVELNGIEPINVEVSNEIAADCDTQNGSITLSVTGGTPPYSYSWPDSIPYTDGNYAEGLWGAKIYTVRVSDTNLCTTNHEFVIGNIGAPEVAVHTTKPKCGLANGSIEIELLSENNAIYEWEGFENTSSTLENIHSGIYFVTVTANDCPITKRIELTEDINNPLTVDPLLTNASCNDTGGEIALNITGGTPPYAITWDDTELNSSIRTDLSSGNYNFIVTDSVGCGISQDIYLSKEELPQLSLKSLGNAACGETNGFIQLDSLSNEYTFKWSHNDILNDPLAENLTSGLYSVYAINEIGCSTDTVSYYISSSDTDLRIQEVAVISASCNESADGSIEVNAVNGIAPYQYEWDDEAQQTGNIAQNLRPGTYTVLVTDATNCSRVKSITLGQVNPVYISSISKSAPLCPDSEDGSITVTASGGKGNYSFEWSTGDTTQAVTGLGSGTYSVTVYDNNICSDQADITIAAPDTLSLEYSSEKPTCYSTADGQVELSISGGVPPYAVEWEDGSTLKRRFDLTAGDYNVFISDNNNCSISQNIIVAAKDSVSLDYEITSVSCNGGNDGSIRIDSITNANSPLVEWSNGQIGNTLRNVSAGLYEAVITDSNGCNTAFEFEIDSPDSLQIVNDTITDVLCKDGFNGSINFEVIGGNGNYSFNWDDGPRTSNRSSLTAGIYQVTVTDDLNCTIEKQFTVNEPNPLILNYTAASISCFGSADGYASIDIEGGISPYQISWADGVVDSVRNDLSAGTHDVLVTDANNCSESIEVIIPNLNPIRINEVIQTIPSCYQGTDGGLELDIIGGNAPYTISWENGETGASLNNISAGNYQVTITDDNNCQLTELITLGDGTPIYLTSVTTANPICYGEPSGMIDVVPDGGNPPFEVVWEDGTRSSSREDLLAGTHVFDVVDSTGCSVSYEITIQDPPLEEINNLPSEVFLCTGGVANLDAGDWSSYSWTSNNGFSSNEREISIDAEGNYNLTVTNEAGCEDQHQFSVIKDDNILSADFLLTSEAVVLDTVIIVDVSWTIPDSVRWINPDDPDFYLVSQTDEYQEVIFTRTGEFELSMKANLDLCEADVSKTITVLSREEAARLSEEANKYNSNDLHISTSIYPNPNHGDFRIEMKGNMEYDHNSKIIDVNTGIEYYRFNGKKQMNYIFNVGDNRLPDGVYLLVMEAEGETITKRFIVK